MGVILIVLGIVLFVAVSWFWGLVVIILGLLLLFWPHDNAYGYSRWRGRRRGPPTY